MSQCGKSYIHYRITENLGENRSLTLFHTNHLFPLEDLQKSPPIEELTVSHKSSEKKKKRKWQKLVVLTFQCGLQLIG